MERSSNHVLLGIGTGTVDLSGGMGKARCQNSTGKSSFHVVKLVACCKIVSVWYGSGHAENRLHCMHEV